MSNRSGSRPAPTSTTQPTQSHEASPRTDPTDAVDVIDAVTLDEPENGVELALEVEPDAAPAAGAGRPDADPEVTVNSDDAAPSGLDEDAERAATAGDIDPAPPALVAPVEPPATHAKSDTQVPDSVLRQWSDALAAAGIFAEALQVHPSAERADVVRRAELAVLADDPQTALDLLRELEEQTTARTAGTARALSKGWAKAQPKPAPSPWLELLGGVAQVLSGQVSELPAVLRTARRLQPSAGVSWVVALAAIAADDLEHAAPAAGRARAGGCRDQRILAVSAADRAVAGDDWAAIELIRGAQKVALPDEDPADLVVQFLERSGHRGPARRLAARASTDTSLSGDARAAWNAAAKRVGAGHKQLLRRAAAGLGGTRRRENAEKRSRAESFNSLTCRCYGSGGWIGQDRMYYVNRHLDQVLPVPVGGLEARLLRCRATNLTFLDLPGREFTLPVVSAVSQTVHPHPVDPFHDPEADPAARPTPGMGVSLGMALLQA